MLNNVKHGRNKCARPAYMLLVMTVVLALSACSRPDSSNPNPESPKSDAAVVETEDKRLGAADIPDEVYSDSDTFSAPRLQFVVRIKESGLQEIWSSRLDGTDVRRVVSAALLSTPKSGAVNHPPARSPDNRYIVYSTNPEGPIEKRIIDLKERTVEVIATGGGIPSFQWTPDSGNIIFALVGGEYNDRVQYNLDTRKITKKKHMKNSGGMYLIPHNMHFIAMTYDGFAEYDFEGGLIREVKLAERIQKYPYYDVSRNGELLLYADREGNHLIKINDPATILVSFRDYQCLVLSNRDELRCLKGGDLVAVNNETTEEKNYSVLSQEYFT